MLASWPPSGPCAVLVRAKSRHKKSPWCSNRATARALLDDLFGAVSGAAIYRNASFLTGKLGERVASEALTIIDDGGLPGLFGSTPFDDEGVISRRTPVIERGVLVNYLNNSYTARRLGLKTTGNASRGLSWQRERGSREPVHRGGRACAGEDSCGREERPVCHPSHRDVGGHSDRRLLIGVQRPVDRKWRVGVSCQRDYDRGKFETNAERFAASGIGS